MKIRCDFVTNSSSSSFLLCANCLRPASVEKIISEFIGNNFYSRYGDPEQQTTLVCLKILERNNLNNFSLRGFYKILQEVFPDSHTEEEWDGFAGDSYEERYSTTYYAVKRMLDNPFDTFYLFNEETDDYQVAVDRGS